MGPAVTAPSPEALRAAVIRPVRPGDIDAITAIYGHHVMTGVSSFEEAPPDAAEMRWRFGALAVDEMPAFVAEAGTQVVAYAYAGYYRTRPAYRNTVEDSVYVDAACIGAGLGKRLLNTLIEDCTARGFRQMLGIISDLEGPSIALHKSCGFVEAGRLRSVGFKHGRWIDTMFMQRPLGAGDGAPPG